ncbi:MAG: DUF2924 domain-containing protein [Aureliella sp.]
MKLDIDREVAALEGMSTGQLCERYAELFGEPVRTRHKRYLVRKIAWRLQAMAETDRHRRDHQRGQRLLKEGSTVAGGRGWLGRRFAVRSEQTCRGR